VGTNQNTIEINGKKYNIITGKIMGIDTSTVGKSTDGLVNNSRVGKKPNRIKAPHLVKTSQKSQTLMRKVVKKPNANQKNKSTSLSGINKPILKTTHQREYSALSAPKSPMISHFGDLESRSSVVKKVQHLPIKKELVHPKIQTTHTSPVLNVEQNSQSNTATSELIKKALANSTSHEQTAHHKPKRRRIGHKLGVSARTLAISSTVLAGVLLGGFFAIQNVPNLSMRVASARAGFNASLPGYNPSGFSFKGPISYTPGQVKITYASNTDDRSYELTQRASNWNSDALLSNYVVVSNQQYQTYLDRGRTLFIYNGSNATWVDNGVWYQIEGNSQMTTDQLVRIAASM
jgi:hypothetical protein